MTAVTPEIRKLVRDMAETMYSAPGVGLAATQVDVHRRVIVIDVSRGRDDLQVFINPVILASGWRSRARGGLPVGARLSTTTSTRASASRPRPGRTTASRSSFEAEGMLAVCIQHEMDHLIGKVFVDYLSPLKQCAHRGQAEKQQRLAG